MTMCAADLLENGLGHPFDPSQHEMLDDCGNGAWLGYLRRRLKRDDLFIYRHRKWGSFVLCAWVSRPSCGTPTGLMQEIEVMDSHPDHYSEGGTLPDIDRLLICFNTPAEESVQKSLAAIRRGRETDFRQKSEESAYRTDLEAHERRHGNDREADMIACGAADFSSPDIPQHEIDDIARRMRERNRCTVRVL